MVYAVRERNCAKCAAVVKGRIPATRDVLCINCACDKARDAALQMANKGGPVYDRWLQTRGPGGRPRAVSGDTGQLLVRGKDEQARQSDHSGAAVGD